jgi:hypothetical protein
MRRVVLLLTKYVAEFKQCFRYEYNRCANPRLQTLVPFEEFL